VRGSGGVAGLGWQAADTALGTVRAAASRSDNMPLKRPVRAVELNGRSGDLVQRGQQGGWGEAEADLSLV